MSCYTITNKLIEILKAGFDGWAVDNQSVTIADGVYPNSIVDEIGTNRFPAIMLQDVEGVVDESFTSETYRVIDNIKILVYIDIDGSVNMGVAQRQSLVENKIIDILTNNFNLGIQEGTWNYEGYDHGIKSDGDIDYWTANYYATVAVSEITTNVHYKRC